MDATISARGDLPYSGELNLLAQRVDRMKRSAKRLFLYAILPAICGVVLALTARWAAPSEAISSVHLPEEVLSLYSKSVNGGGGASPLISHAFLGEAGSYLKVAVPMVALIASVMLAVATRSFFPLIHGIMLATAMSVMASVVGGMVGIDDGPAMSEHEALVTYAENANTNQLGALLGQKALPDWLREYVMAQAWIVWQKEKKAEVSQKWRDDLARGVRSVITALGEGERSGINARVEYALEKRTQGAAVSQVAKDYVVIAEGRVSLLSAMSLAAFVMFFGGWVIAGVLRGLCAMLALRVERVSELVRRLAIPA